MTSQEIANRPDADIISFAKVDFPGNVETNISWENKNDLKILFMFGNPVYHPTVCVKTSVLKSLKYCDFELPNGATIKGVEDYYLWCRCFLAGFNIHNCSMSVIKYRKWNGQISNSKKKRIPLHVCRCGFKII